MNSTEATVFVVDDDLAARQSVGTLVEAMGIKAEVFSSAEEFLAAYDESRPGCLVSDVRMLGMSGVELQEQLARIGSELPVILITAYSETPLVVRAMKGGAFTFLEKPCREEELWDAIREALDRDSQNLQGRAMRREFQSRLAQLSDQEREVLHLLVEGKAHKVIARHLDVSVRTVESRRGRILKKMRTKSLVELARLLVENGARKVLR